MPSRAIGNDVALSLIPIVDSQCVAPNCPRSCRSAAPRSSIEEHRSVVQILKPAAIEPCVVQHPVRVSWRTIRKSTSQRPSMLCRRGGARSLIATQSIGAGPACWMVVAGTEMAPSLAVGRVQQLSTIGFAAHGITGAPLARLPCAVAVGSSFTDLHRQVSRL